MGKIVLLHFCCAAIQLIHLSQKSVEAEKKNAHDKWQGTSDGGLYSDVVISRAILIQL